jgi:hypothetical protein
MSVSLNTQLASQVSSHAAAHESQFGSKTLATVDDVPPLCPDPPPIPHPLATLDASASYSTRLEQVALNPQPLPPGESGGIAPSVRADVDDIPLCPPPPPRPWLDAVGQPNLEVLNALGVSGGPSGQAGQERGIIIIGG